MSLSRRAVALSARPNWREQPKRESLTGAQWKLTKMPADAAAGLRVRERVLLFCAASGTDWRLARVPSEVVTTMMVNGFVNRDVTGEIVLTDSGRAVLRALLGEL
jgi:hypothetical protein